MATAVNTEVGIGQSLIATKYTYVASATLLFWDMALTADKEYQRVWKAKKGFGTTLFLWNRYLPPAIFILDLAAQFRWDPSMKLYVCCKAYELSSTLLDFVVIAIVETILVIRTHALYSNKKLLCFLVLLAAVSLINMLTCFILISRRTTFLPAATFGLVGCMSGCTHPICKPLLIVFWIPFLLFETTIFMLTAWKSYSTFRATQRLGDNYGRRLIEALLFRDGMIYYLVIMATSLMNFFIWIFDPFASYLAVGILKCLQATICSRLLLNIRGMLEPQYMKSVSILTRTEDVSLASVDRRRQSIRTKSFGEYESMDLQSLHSDQVREERRSAVR